tara:strand:+ start:573 stop:809 length:237 start_codon:yes stop_codon:yes gene_type:complete
MLNLNYFGYFLIGIIVTLIYNYLITTNQSNKNSSLEGRNKYPFVTPVPETLYLDSVLIPWNYSTIGPDTNRRTFEIGN